MNLFFKSILLGFLSATFLMSVALLAGSVPQLKAFQSIAIYLLTPGIVLGFAVGSGRVHDMSFWVLTAILNALIFSVLAVPCIFVLDKIRSRNSSRTTDPHL